ncbi:M67 family metallopeptidase [Paenibacillus glycanilyticus]|uniref:M67 family metallopeptidase n=1 Tax=Paenibacillus glycanilyticus TaxID=126569 RepID=UPI00203AFBD7|nr:M67 family metallopeptidase [Paenibacillus glycanilyticus]MCM3627194.1 M67 family metallopeptidase [Paenibacillus glycanilyticus]
MQAIAITHQAHKQLLRLCSLALPREACGVLAGTEAAEAGHATVTDIRSITNVHEDPLRSFRFHPGEWVSAYYDMQKNRQSLVGFFHSHPTSSALPSKRDTLGLPASDRQISYWIISMAGSADPFVQPYLLENGTFRPLALMLA